MKIKEKPVSHVIFIAAGKGSRAENIASSAGLPKQLIPINGRSSIDHVANAVQLAYPDA